jgi:thiamine-monophosphate kinase
MISEFDIIARHFAPIAGAGGLGLLDDAALLKPSPGHDLIVTTDAVVAGVHFFADDPADTVARKALGTNLSDLAAKGARPIAFLLTLMLPKTSVVPVDDTWLARFAAGLGALAAQSGCVLVGGDTVSTPGALSISITAMGEVPAGTMVRRSTGQSGDSLFVTGTIGDAAIGLQLVLSERKGEGWPLSDDHLAFLRERYRVPKPRNVLAEILRQHAHAAMDVSDGYAGDLIKLVGLTGCGADVILDDVPLSVAARAAIRHQPQLQETALTGGDDYELLVAVPPARSRAFVADCLAAGVAVAKIGHITRAGAPIRFLEADGSERQFRSASYIHG